MHISIFNTIGQEIKILHDGKSRMKTGKFIWDASNLSSGNYYIILKSKDQLLSEKVVLIK